MLKYHNKDSSSFISSSVRNRNCQELYFLELESHSPIPNPFFPNQKNQKVQALFVLRSEDANLYQKITSQ